MREPIADAAIERFVERDYARLVSVLALVLGSLPAAEDAVQDALAKAWLEAERGRTIEALPAWVTAVALNGARSVLRRRNAESRAYERVSIGGRVNDRSIDEAMAIADAIRSLPRRQREVVVLRHQLGYDTAATAQILEISEGTVKNALHRALARLAELLSANGDDDAY